MHSVDGLTTNFSNSLPNDKQEISTFDALLWQNLYKYVLMSFCISHTQNLRTLN